MIRVVRTTVNTTSGMVLIMTLAALAVMMILLLALFHGASHQIRGAQGDASLAREKILADSAVALVIGQIQEASSQAGQTWISQPGLLRTYAASATRAPTACYKLYSTPTLAGMVDTTGNLAFFGTDIPANWSSTPNQYTDLNSPVQTVGGASIYPILDPGALTTAANLSAGTEIEGLSSDSTATDPVTMPVAWLYQLQDGTLGPAGNGTAANPIVARIAFWTDDETCKININTAACGSPWNTPRANSTDDVAWSTTQPAAGEYSAYPGHPATTSLATVFEAAASPPSPQQLLAMSPRYAWGGSAFGTQATTPGESVSMKFDRLYASLHEWYFSSTLSGAGQRAPNPVTANQLEMARFVLTAHSRAPETTLLGEPRIAIWPVADSASAVTPQTTTTVTATDNAVVSAATVGVGTSNVRSYFFQRNNPLKPKDDFDPATTGTSTSYAATTSNLQLFNDLVNRGNLNLPGYGATLLEKYPGVDWTQLMLEITDFIHGINAVDPSPAPFVPFAPGNSTTNVGHAFVDPLTTTYGSGATQVTLRGFGRCPTLSSLTLVFYVSGFGFKNGTYIDYDETPDNLAGTSWKANFLPGSAQWKNVTSERIRAFVVPCTFQPGCGYPEVSDACTIQISGLTNIKATCGTASSNFGFTSPAVSVPLGTPLKVLPADRAWGGNEGPMTWRSAGDGLDNGGAMNYPFANGFAAANALVLPMQTTASQSQLDPKTGGANWPPTTSATLSLVGGTNLIVVISDTNANVLQTLTVSLPAFSCHTPTLNGECDHADAIPPLASDANWATDTACQVYPSWYMCLRHRLQTSQNSRAVLFQAGDITRSVEAAVDLRVLAGLSTVPSTLFQPHPYYSLNAIDGQNGSHAHNLRFADGTSACFAPGDYAPLDNADSAMTSLVYNAVYPVGTATIAVHDWRTGALLVADSAQIVPYTYFTNAPCSVPTGDYDNGATMTPVTQSANPSPLAGDWDTGPGFAADGAQINLPDAGTALAPATAYFSLTGGQLGAATQRTPSALVPSPVIFGSLPAGINPSQPAQSVPWDTLLFCPYPPANTSNTPYTMHPGSASPPDHLILDNFWMPVVEPYAISTCMATAGKINLNDQIAPFTYLHRNTAFHALLNDLRIPAISVGQAYNYKSPGTPFGTIWNTVDENATIAQIENRFANNSVDAYLSESEICTVPLVPTGQASDNVADTQANLAAFWSGNSTPDGGLTGTNLRDLPYAQLYGRLTTRSNSYTVHLRVQVLQKLPHDPHQNVWNEGVDVVLGDWRGSYEIERCLDPAAPAPVSGSPLGPYKFRIVSARRFAP